MIQIIFCFGIEPCLEPGQLYPKNVQVILQKKTAILKIFCIQCLLFQLLDFGKVHRSDLGRAVRSYEQAVEAVQANIQWMQKNLNIVINWLNQNA